MGTQFNISMSYSKNTLNRIQKDYLNLQKEPVLNAGAQPRNDDLTFWDAAIEVTITHNNKPVKVPLHFNIEFPSDYPQSPPNIGFSYEFRYELGASYFNRKPGRLQNKLVLCLDLLGNFADIHSEWKSNVGSGWSPAYTVGSLLINLQAILSELDQSYRGDPNSKNKLINSAEKFRKSHGVFLPEIATEEICELARLKKEMDADLLKLAKEIEVDNNLGKMKKLQNFFTKNQVTDQLASVKITPKRRIDENIRCYVTGNLYTEDVLGYGISAVQQGRQTNLSTPAELLSFSAYQQGTRQSTNKTQFSFFLPAFINPDHGPRNQNWTNCLKSSISKIGSEVFEANDLVGSATQIFPRLINTLVLEMFKLPEPEIHEYFRWEDRLGDAENMRRMEEFDRKMEQIEADSNRMNKSPSIAYFEAICSLWRTYLWLNETVLKKKLLPVAVSKIDNFVKFEKSRFKSETPDVGSLLASFTAVQHHCKSGTKQFIDCLLDETFTRNVLWWKRANVKQSDPKAVFNQIETSRKIILFQIYFLRFIIGANPEKTAALLDNTNGKAPQLLEEFFKQWKTTENIDCWLDFMRASGCSNDLMNFSGKQLVDNAVRKAKERGSAYWPRPKNY